MEAVVAFDTHRFVKNLTANGFTERQAETLAAEQVHLLNSNLATRMDIEKVNERIERVEERIERVDERIEAFQADIAKRIEAFQADIAKRIEAFQADTAKRIEAFQADTAKHIAELKADLQRWFITVIVAVAGIAIAAGALVVGLLNLL